jgi:hypothetical protein
MGLLTALSAGLASLAGECGAWAGDVAAAFPTSGTPGAPGQASAAAVAAIQARAGLSAETLSARMTSNATAFTATAVGFAAQDTQSAASLTGVSPDI